MQPYQDDADFEDTFRAAEDIVLAYKMAYLFSDHAGDILYGERMEMLSAVCPPGMTQEALEAAMDAAVRWGASLTPEQLGTMVATISRKRRAAA